MRLVLPQQLRAKRPNQRVADGHRYSAETRGYHDAERNQSIAPDHSAVPAGRASSRRAAFEGTRLTGGDGPCEVCEAVGLASSLIATNSCVLLLDGDLPDDGAARFLGGVAANLRRRTIVLAGSLAAADVADLLRAGAGGALSKRGQVSDLVVAIRTVTAGSIWVDAPFLEALVRLPERLVRGECRSPSSRESQILRFVRRGMTNKQIASGMGISEAAVKAGLQRLFQKFGVKNRAELVQVTKQELS